MEALTGLFSGAAAAAPAAADWAFSTLPADTAMFGAFPAASAIPLLGASTGGGLMSALSGLGTAGTALGGLATGVKGIESLASGGQSPATTTPPPQAMSTITGTPIAPSTSPSDYTKSQQAYWEQMLSGLGLPGGGLPADIQAQIDKQAGLLRG